MSFDAFDESCMDEALALAARAYGCTSPNPMVGAVLASGRRVVGSGFHRRAGSAHAEIEALNSFAGDSSDDLTLYVNLEPCSHQGRTPPCTEAILRSRITRVVASILDPDARVAGQGVERLRAGGLRVELHCRAGAARELNHIFLRRQATGRPFVALKVARAGDGSIAAADGSPVAITGDVARRHTHGLRAGHDAILIGVETLRRDRPRLDIRLHRGPGRAPRRIVLDPSLRAETDWLWPGSEVRPLVCTSRGALDREGRRLEAHADLVVLPETAPGELDLPALLEVLAARELWSVLVEGGGRTHRRFLAAGLWDRLYMYSHPGPGIGGLAWDAGAAFGRAPAVLHRSESLGADRLEVFEPRLE